MKDKYENSRTKQKNKKQKVCGQDSCPTSAITLHNTGRSHNCHLSQCGTSTQLSLTLHNVGPTHNCHSFYTTSTPLPRNCRHPRQHITPMRLSPILHNTGLPQNHRASSKHTAWNICGRGGGTPRALGSSLPAAHTPSKRADLGGVGRKNTAVQATRFEFTITWELFTNKDCLSQHVSTFPLAPAAVGGRRRGHTGPPHRPAGQQSCRLSLALTAAHVRRRVADQSCAK